MSLEGLKASCIKSGLALVGTDGTVYYCPPEAQLPDALRNALARADSPSNKKLAVFQTGRVRGLDCDPAELQQ